MQRKRTWAPFIFIKSFPPVSSYCPPRTLKNASCSNLMWFKCLDNACISLCHIWIIPASLLSKLWSSSWLHTRISLESFRKCWSLDPNPRYSDWLILLCIGTQQNTTELCCFPLILLCIGTKIWKCFALGKGCFNLFQIY